MVSGQTGFQCGEDKYLAVTGNAPDSSGAVADIEIPFPIEGDYCGHAHAFGISGNRSIWRNAINRAVISRGDVEKAIAIKSHAGRVHEIRDKRLGVVVGINLVDRNWNLLATAAGKGDVDV